MKIEKVGWGLMFGLLPCWIIKEEESQPEPYGPMLMGGVVSEMVLWVIMKIYCFFLAIYNLMVQDEDCLLDPMFIIWISPKTRMKLKGLGYSVE